MSNYLFEKQKKFVIENKIKQFELKIKLWM